jgi:hypothetical protein
MLARPDDGEKARGRTASGWHGDLSPPAQELPGDRVWVLADIFDGAGGHDLPTVLARPRPNIYDKICFSYSLFVVLHDDHGIAQIAQPFERLEQSNVIALMEPDAWLI